MDGMNWFPTNEIDAIATAAMERKAVRTALKMTVASIVFTLGLVLALDAMHMHPVAVEEFATAPVTD